MDSLDKLYNGLDLEQKQLVMDFTKSHPRSLVAPLMKFIQTSHTIRVWVRLDSLYQQLDTAVRVNLFMED